MPSLEELANRLDDGVTALERIADALEALAESTILSERRRVAERAMDE